MLYSLLFLWLFLVQAASGQDASIVKGPHTQVIEKGEDFTISCRTNIQNDDAVRIMLRNDSPNRKVIYKSDDTERTLVEKYTYLTSEPNLHRITVHNATEDDAGAYICQLVQSREKQTGFITVVSGFSLQAVSGHDAEKHISCSFLAYLSQKYKNLPVAEISIDKKNLTTSKAEEQCGEYCLNATYVSNYPFRSVDKDKLVMCRVSSPNSVQGISRELMLSDHFSRNAAQAVPITAIILIFVVFLHIVTSNALPLS